MTSTNAIDLVKAPALQSVNAESAAADVAPAAATTSPATASFASRAALRVIDGANQSRTAGLSSPATSATLRSRTAAITTRPTLAAYDGGSVHANAVAIQKMVNSCTLLVFCISKDEERQIVSILNATPAAQRPALIGELAQMGVLDDMLRKFNTNDRQMLRNYVLTNIGGIQDPAVIASTLSATNLSSQAEVLAIVHSLRSQLGDAKAEQVLQLLVAKGMLSRPLPFMSPLYLYSNCDTFWGVLQQQQMTGWLERERAASRVKLEAVLAQFPPNSLAAAQLRSQLDAQYTVERVNDMVATMSCLSQSRYQTYYQSNYPDFYQSHRPSSGDGFGSSFPSSGDGFGSSSGDGFGSSSGDGFGSSSGDGFGSSSGSYGSSGDGFGSSSSSGSSSGDGF